MISTRTLLFTLALLSWTCRPGCGQNEAMDEEKNAAQPNEYQYDLEDGDEYNDIELESIEPAVTPIFTFIVEGILLVSVSVIGILGNIFAIIVLTKSFPFGTHASPGL